MVEPDPALAVLFLERHVLQQLSLPGIIPVEPGLGDGAELHELDEVRLEVHHEPDVVPDRFLVVMLEEEDT